eukprot:733906-Rhodomonas_salina.1
MGADRAGVGQLGEESQGGWMQGLGDGLEVHERSGKVEIKGKGLMQTYCLARKPLQRAEPEA